LIGKNGCGKTSLLNQIYDMMNIQSVDSVKIDTLYVTQSIDHLISLEKNPIDFIMDSNSKLKIKTDELQIITKQLENIELEDDTFNMLNDRSIELYDIVNTWNPETEKANVIKILKGLGFTDTKLNEESKLLSGGWLMRLSLARALYLKPSLLLLDEPTNHLDLEAIIWLSDYLNTCNKTVPEKHSFSARLKEQCSFTVLVVSHNIGFLNDTCDYIINIMDKKLVYYKGNYNAFKESVENKYKEMKNNWEKYEKQLKEIKKKGLKDKIIEFEKKNKVIKPDIVEKVYIDIETGNKINGNIIEIYNLCFSYKNNSNSILQNITCGLDMNSKIALVGVNGSGKSTFIKLITGELVGSSDSININKNAIIGYYNQHFESSLPQDMTPLDYLLSFNNTDINTIRQHFGKIKLDKSCYNKNIQHLSGGQKARVALVKIFLMKPHFLILDEPTNHLDIETVDALINGLANFNGGILLITHESEMIKKLNSIIWRINPLTKNISYYDTINF